MYINKVFLNDYSCIKMGELALKMMYFASRDVTVDSIKKHKKIGSLCADGLEDVV